MPDQILVLYGSYRSDRMGIRLANFVVSTLRSRDADAELIDARAVSLPMLDRMYKEFAPGTAPPAMEVLATNIKAADAFVFVTGEYNWGMQPSLRSFPRRMILAPRGDRQLFDRKACRS
jgi:NAD(P)H-dependent FMN reductase